MIDKRILIVDDDADFVKSLVLRCRTLGLEVESASNALTAITMAEVHPPDLICLDVGLPTANGLDVCEFLAQNPAVAGRPFIILTGQSGVEIERRCHQLHARYIHKSTDFWKQFRSSIEVLLDVELSIGQPA